MYWSSALGNCDFLHIRLPPKLPLSLTISLQGRGPSPVFNIAPIRSDRPLTRGSQPQIYLLPALTQQDPAVEVASSFRQARFMFHG